MHLLHSVCWLKVRETSDEGMVIFGWVFTVVGGAGGGLFTVVGR
jgi:hypothetical protein